MRIFLLGIVFTLMIPPAKVPKFKYLNKSVPLYIGIKKSPKNTEDEVVKLIKDSLSKAGFRINTFEENLVRVKQFAKDVQVNTKMLTKRDLETKDAMIEKLYSGVTAIQEILIIYVSGADSVGTYESYDQVGFTHISFPQNASPPFFPVLMFKEKEIGSRMPDSIARFLLKKM